MGLLAFGGQGRSVVPFDFKGRMLVAVSDADMLASAYADGDLGPAQGADALSIVRLDRPPAKREVATTRVGNSVTGPPAAMAVTKDGRTAIVVETLGPRGRGMTTLKQLPVGRSLAVVDLSNPDRPRVVQRVACPAQPQTVSIDPGGTCVAVTFGLQGDGKTIPLAIYRLKDGRLSTLASPTIPGWTLGHSLIDAEFSPQGDALALLDFTAAELRLVRIGAGGALTPWGDAVPFGKAPYFFLARFSPDGRTVLANTIGETRGTVFSVRLAEDGRHRLVSQASTGAGPEGLAVSPDGRWVATSNLEQSYRPKTDPKQGYFSSLSLLRLDPETSVLTPVGDYPFEGILSETVLFDDSSRYLAATVFDRFDDRKPAGAIGFWRIAGDADDPTRAELVRVGPTIPVPRGIHTMVIVRRDEARP